VGVPGMSLAGAITSSLGCHDCVALDINTCGYCNAQYRVDTCQLIALLLAIADPSRGNEMRFC